METSVGLRAVVLLAGALGLIVVWNRVGFRWTVLVAALCALTLAPFSVIRLSTSSTAYGVGIAAPVPTIATFTFVLLVGGIVIAWMSEWRRESLLCIPLLLWMVFGWLFLWPHSAQVASGILHWLTVACAWAVGCLLGKSLGSAGREARIVVFSIFGICCLLGSSVAWQLISTSDLNTRATGLFSHPATIGKLAVLFCWPLLPLTQSTDVLVRRLAYLALLICFGMTAPTLSRANIIGLVVVVLIWVSLSFRSQGLGRRAWLVIFMAAAFLPVFYSVLSRFDKDAEGGNRPELLAAGLRQIARNPFAGTGPNGYVPDVANRELIVAITGYPVHNSFLLVVAELGVVGAVLALLPILAVMLGALRRIGGVGRHKDISVASLAVFGGILCIGITGWGMVQEPVCQVWYLFAGMAFGQMRRQDEEPQESETLVGRRRQLPLASVRSQVVEHQNLVVPRSARYVQGGSSRLTYRAK